MSSVNKISSKNSFETKESCILTHSPILSCAGTSRPAGFCCVQRRVGAVWGATGAGELIFLPPGNVAVAMGLLRSVPEGSRLFPLAQNLPTLSSPIFSTTHTKQGRSAQIYWNLPNLNSGDQCKYMWWPASSRSGTKTALLQHLWAGTRVFCWPNQAFRLHPQLTFISIGLHIVRPWWKFLEVQSDQIKIIRLLQHSIHGIILKKYQKFQMVQNAETWVSVITHTRDQVTTILYHLHQLPVNFWVQFNSRCCF